MAPRDKPATNCFCGSTNTTSAGTAAISAAAAIRFWSETNWPCKLASAEVIGRSVPVEISVMAQKKSL
ncbi:MAG TPA: hypothetical protein VMU94_10620 [Streptosporangiaceae bacterium]|nr:hypothetical protein [Streptosporangiaceae bacterium]